jgi:hypothetical protein
MEGHPELDDDDDDDEIVVVAKLHSLSFNTLEFLNIAHASIWAHELGSATSSGSNTI